MKRTCGYRGRRHAVPLGLLLAALCALLALAFLFFYTPMRFSGCLLLCAAVYFVLWHFLWLRREHRLARAVLVILDWRFGSIYCAGGSNHRLWPHRPGKSGFCRGGAGSRSEWHKAVFGAAKPFGGGVGLCFGIGTAVPPAGRSRS